MTYFLKCLLVTVIYLAGDFIGRHFGNSFDAGWYSGVVSGVLAISILGASDE